MAVAARALGTKPRRVLLTVGGLQLAAFAAAPQHHYVIRTIDPPDAAAALPDHRLILARGPFALADETALMRDGRIDVLVTKTAAATRPKPSWRRRAHWESRS
jgi:precorrin-6A/cobalt-precorrin-6A reductase